MTTPRFRKTNRGGVVVIEWIEPQLAGVVTAAFSTRLGGVSAEPFAELNLSTAVGDDTVAVAENRARFFAAVGADAGEVVCATQVHGNDILVADVSGADQIGVTTTGQPLWRMGPGDGLVTDRPGRFLATFHADCAPIYLVDPVSRVIGLVHAGWRGTVARVAARGVEAMCSAGARPGDIRAAIGPAIGPCCYEVDGPVIDQVNQEFGAEAVHLLRPHRPGYSLFDLWEANRRVLLAAGIPDRNIATARMCTHCSPELFYSYRRARGRPSGRMMAIVGLHMG